VLTGRLQEKDPRGGNGVAKRQARTHSRIVTRKGEKWSEKIKIKKANKKTGKEVRKK